MSDVHFGGCVCGAVRYTVRGEPAAAFVCHCKFCQRRTGSAFAITVYFKIEDVELLEGALSSHEHKSDESGRWIQRHFCTACGTPISHIAEMRPGLRAIAGGTFDDPNWFSIKQHIWTKSKQAWVSIPANFKPPTETRS